MGERPFTVAMMNMIFKGEMEASLTGNDNPDWKEIETRIKAFGAPAEEILLRAKTVHFINHQDWANYVPTAKVYLEKFGDNITAQEKTMFQQAIDQHPQGTKASASTQDENKNDNSKEAIAAKDKIIKEQIIDPSVNTAVQANKIPDWAEIANSISKIYDTQFADRTITRAKLFYYYSKDWKEFATAIVNYTEKYEDKTDRKTLGTNANFVLEHSTDKKELAAALSWIQIILEKDPGNEAYKKTRQALDEKLKAN